MPSTLPFIHVNKACKHEVICLANHHPTHDFRASGKGHRNSNFLITMNTEAAQLVLYASRRAKRATSYNPSQTRAECVREAQRRYRNRRSNYISMLEAENASLKAKIETLETMVAKFMQKQNIQVAPQVEWGLTAEDLDFFDNFVSLP